MQQLVINFMTTPAKVIKRNKEVEGPVKITIRKKNEIIIAVFIHKNTLQGALMLLFLLTSDLELSGTMLPV